MPPSQLDVAFQSTRALGISLMLSTHAAVVVQDATDSKTESMTE